MRNLDRVFESWVNVRHTVLGKHLKPFCLLHYLWLEQIGSPLVNTEKPCTLSDLEIAVLICSSSSSEEIQGKLAVENFWQRMKAGFWHRKNAREPLSRQIKAFLAYQDDYLCLPNYGKKENGETEEKLPWLLVTAAALIKETGWSEEVVFTMPIGKVFWLASTISFLKTGETVIISDKAQEAEEFLTKLYNL